jgi:3-oxoacyl-[acyl-carrier protein] reductase
MFNLNLSGRTYIVTGASSGIGRDVCVLLSQFGARIILVARNQEKLNQTFSLLDNNDHRIEAFDLEDISNIPSWFSSVVKEVGPISGIVHSAGIDLNKPLQILEHEEVVKVLNVNLVSAIFLLKSFRKKQNHVQSGASVVLISSIMGLVGRPGISVYSASKGALISLTKSLSLEFVKDSIRINCVCPGYVETELIQQLRLKLSAEQFSKIIELHPLGIGQPRDISNVVAFLLADCSRWITGTSISVDGGYTAS